MTLYEIIEAKINSLNKSGIEVKKIMTEYRIGEITIESYSGIFFKKYRIEISRITIPLKRKDIKHLYKKLELIYRESRDELLNIQSQNVIQYLNNTNCPHN